MRALSGRELARILERHGWTLLRIHGSHHIFGKSGVRTKLSVPIHGNQSLKPGLQRYFLRVAGLAESDFG
jgi:predicted RNA binding protein YcfA (HicA-like mRNA interferase family)